jgi:plastocyanin
VKFTNNGAQPHNATSSDGGGFDTGLLSKGETAAVTFNRPGSYTYICTPHPSMIGQIIVTGQAVAEAPPTVVGPSTPRPEPQHGAH